MNTNVFIPVDKFQKEKDYWLEKLSGDLKELRLLPDFPGKRGYRAATYQGCFDRQMDPLLMRISKNNPLSLFVILLTVVKILLFKYSGQEEIIVSSPTYSVTRQTYNRNVVFRDFIDPAMTFKEILFTVKQTVAEGYKNQYFPIRQLIDLLNPLDGEAAPQSLFRVIVLLENIHDKESLGEITVNYENDIIFAFAKTREGLDLEITYNRELFKEDTIQRLCEGCWTILQQVLHDTNISITGIELMTERQRHEILYVFNDTRGDYPHDKKIHELFAQQALDFPDRAAVCLGNHHLTYGVIDRCSDGVAGILAAKGVSVHCIVGLMMYNSLEMVSAILGVLKTGAAYLPIDPDSPPGRTASLMEDSNARILLKSEIRNPKFETNPNDRNSNDQNERTGITVLNFKDLYFEICLKQRDFVPRAWSLRDFKSSNLAYIIYTSGTTGKPKGILVEHRGIVNYTWWRMISYRYTGKDVTLQLLSYCFDGFGANFYSSLLSGSLLVMVPDSRKLDSRYIVRTLRQRCVTNMSLVPGMYEALLEAAEAGDLQTLRFVVLAGERSGAHVLGKSSARNPGLMHINEYGPTEASVTAAANLDMTPGNNRVIGSPIANTCIYILDMTLQPVPLGAPGELCISGVGVARGYLNNPELTHERFLSFSSRSYGSYKTYISKKLYKTGDLGRWLPGGSLEYLGRLDQQVKIRGYRIELGEIENQLRQQEKIKDAVVIARDVPGEKEKEIHDKYLCAYIVSQELLEAADLKEFLAAKLPDYMVPSHFVRVEKIPLTENGKVDRRALPEPDSTVHFTGPRDEIEEKLAGIWSEILGIEKQHIGIDHNFFQLGGHSLKATIQAALIHKQFDVEVPLEEMFILTTIRELALYIKKKEKKIFAPIAAVEKKEYYALSPAQKRLYVLRQVFLEDTTYNVPMMMPLQGKIDLDRFENTFKKLIRRHESFRTSFEMVDEEPVQRIHDEIEFKIEYDEFSGHPSSFLVHHFIRPFDLSRAPLLRAGLLKTDQDRYVLLVDIHHIITDGTSMGILRRDFTALYNEEKLPELKIQYKDFSHWQNQLLKSRGIEKQEAYWLQEFRGTIPVLKLPTDYERPSTRNFGVGAIFFQLDNEKTRALEQLALQEEATLFMVLLAIFYVLLFKLTWQEDIIIGTPIAGRRHADLDQVVGFLVGTLALRGFPQNNKGFKDFLGEVRQKTLMAYENQDFPFDELVAKLDLPRHSGRHPLFDVMVVLGNMNLEPGAGESRKVNNQSGTPPEEVMPQEYEYNPNISRFDLAYAAQEVNGKLLFVCEYNTTIFKKERAERFITYLKEIIESVARDENVKLKDIHISYDLVDRKLNIPQTDFVF